MLRFKEQNNMAKKFIFTLLFTFTFLQTVFSAEPLDSALIASDLKKFQTLRTEYLYDTILFVTPSLEDKVIYNKIEITSQTDKRIEGDGFNRDKVDNSWIKSYKNITIFDDDGNMISEIDISNDHIYGSKNDYYFSKDGLLLKSVVYFLRNNEWSEYKTISYLYEVNNDTITVINTEGDRKQYHNNSIYNSFLNNGIWTASSKILYSFNEDGSIDKRLLVSQSDGKVLDETIYIYKTNTGFEKLDTFVDCFVLNKHLFFSSKKNEKLYIYNASGRNVAIKNNLLGQNIHNLSNFNPGVYLLKTESGKTGKIII